MSTNSFCHIEFLAKDLKRAQKFYKSVFGWTFENFGRDYLLFNPPDGIGGAFSLVDSIPEKTQVIVYINVNDIEKYLEMIIEQGGSLVEIKTEIPNIGYVAKFLDSEGNLVGLFEEYKKEDSIGL